MANPYVSYYAQQSGSGLPAYVGRRHQRGHGLGGILSSVARGVASTLLPIVKTAGRQALQGALREGVGFAGDVLLRRQNVKTAARRRLANTGRAAVGSVVNTLSGAIKRRAPPPTTRPAKARRGDARSQRRRITSTRGRKKRKQTGRASDIFG